MENLIQRGFRVIRGPDWIYKNQDGGKGSAGTVIELQTRCHPYFPEHTVLVQWDSGDKGLYRAGYDQAFDLRILEMTTSTRRHIRIWCDGCNAEEIRGIRWRCSECYAIDLCTTCYMNDKHDTAHVFTRVLSSHKTSKGPKMLPRSSSPRIALRGSFPGAKVVRHPQWSKKLGSDEQHGKVVRHGQRPEENIGAWAMVEFSTKPERMDFTKIICTLPGSGGFVYDGHLPNLGDLEPVNEGDNVLVTATPPELEELHKRRGLWEPNMMKTSGKKGFVNRRTNTGDFEVTFTDTQETFAMNPAALRKLHRFCLGQSVLISDDAEMVQRLQFGHGGWKASMAQAMGRVGKVVKINGSDITVCVKSKRHTYIFNSANLTPARISFSHPKEETLAESFQKFTRFLRKPEMDITLAVAAGDILSVECMLKEHPEWIHYEPRPGKSLLSFAEDVRMMKFLVEKGAFIESYDDGGCTPLMCAADVNNYEGVRYLLDQGADVDATNHLGLTSFALACAHGSFECAHYLLLHGADVNLRSKDDFTPLIRAIEDEGRTILDLILAQKEIDLKAVSSDIYMSAMHYAALGGNTYALTKLIEKAPKMVEAKQCLGNTPIFCAGYASSLKATEVLIKKGHCNVNVQTTGDQTCPLHLALCKHNFHMIEVLVKNGADPNIAIRAGDTCLQMAIDVVEELEAEDLVIKEEPFMAEMKKKWGHLGIKTNGDALLAYLVSHGGDLDRHNSENITIRESLQLKSKESLIHSLDKIQSLTRKDIARQQSSASQPLRNLTQNCPSTVAMDEPVPFNSKDFVAAAKEERNSPGKSSMRYSRAGRKVQPPKSVPEKSSPSYATKKECAAKSQDKSSTSSARPEVKVQDTWNSPKKLPTSSARRLTKIQSVRNSPEKSPMGSAIPGTNLQSPGKPSEKWHGKEARNVSRKGAGDCRVQESKKKTSDKGELHQLQAELQRKDDELKTLRSKVKTLEHLVKKKISFACGHDFIRSIAELIPECPECSDPIASVANI